MDGQRTKAVHRSDVRDVNGTTSTAVLDIKYHRMTVCPPIGKDQRYGPLELTVIHATERGTPDGREPIRWKLVTNLPVACKAETGLQTLRVTVLEPTLVSNKPWSPTVANHY